MKKILFLFLLSLLTMTVAAQKFSWPPKSYPLSVPFIVSDEVKYYWGVDAIVCVGSENGGYKFLVMGRANHDFTSSRTINMYYIDADNKPSIAGAYYFPKVKAGHEFRFEIVSAFPGYTPVGFKGFCIYDERLRIPEEDTEARTKIGSRTSDVDAAYHDSVRIADSIAAVAAIEAERAARVVMAPKYPGDTQALYSFLRKNMRKPQIAIETAGYGTTTVQFIVTRNGEVVGADYKRRCNERVDKEVLRLVNMLSGWTPATKGGKPCDAVVQISMSIFPSFNASAQFVGIR